MTTPSVVHDTIRIKRLYGVPHARIFRAWTVKEEMGWLGPTDQFAFLDGSDTPVGRREGWDDTIAKLDRMFGGWERP